MSEINIYCDESNHLETGRISPMVLGAIYIPQEKLKSANKRVREIKAKYGVLQHTEVKWKKVSSKKIQLYLDLIDYFFDNDDLHFRAIIIDKNKLDHKTYNRTLSLIFERRAHTLNV